MAEIIGRVGWRTFVSAPTNNPLWNNLVAYYTGDNTANDSKGTAHGTLVNGTTYATCKINNGFDFDGINDYISFPVNTFKPTGDFSISFWMLKKNNATPLYMAFIEIGQPYYGNGMFGYNYNGGFAFEVNGGRDIVTPFIPNDVWTHIVITHKASTNYKIYTNGVLATPVPGNYPNTATTTVNPNFSSNNIGMTIGAGLGGQYPSCVKFDEIALFDGAELTQSQITELYNAGAGKQYVAPTPAYTARTSAFATATGITDTTILGALNTFDLGLISNSLDSKIGLLYPFVGSDYSKHSYNFMNPSLFQITWNGGVTHNSNGITGNGVNGYGATGFIPSANLSLNSVHISTYIRTNVNENKCDFGSAAAGNNNGLAIYSRYSNLLITSTNDADTLSSSTTDSRGLIVANRSSSTTRKQFKNGYNVATQTYSSSALNSFGLNLLCSNLNGALSFAYSSKNLAFASVGSSLSDAEQSTFYTLVQNLQTALSRQV